MDDTDLEDDSVGEVHEDVDDLGDVEVIEVDSDEEEAQVDTQTAVVVVDTMIDLVNSVKIVHQDHIMMLLANSMMHLQMQKVK